MMEMQIEIFSPQSAGR